MSMSKSRGSKSAIEIRQFDDALSLDDLDKVVGGSDALPRREGEYYSPSGEGGYTPPPPPVQVHAPADLPPELAAIESHVANDTWTGLQAVHEITSLIGQGDHSLQGIAGAEIATIIGRGELTAADAMTEIHNAVATSHTLTAEQAVGLLSGIMVGQYTTQGVDPSVGDAARAEILNLVHGNQISADHAIGAIAAAASDAPAYSQRWALSPIAILASENHIPAAQVVDDVTSAFDAQHMPATQLVEMLTLIGGSSQDAQMAGAVGTEIGQLVAGHKITAADAMASMHTAAAGGSLMWMQALPMLGAAVDANGDLAAVAGAEFGSMVNTYDSYGQTLATNQLRNLVTSHVLSADEAVVMLAGMAEAGHAAAATTAIVNLYVNNHLSVAQVMADIQTAVAANALNGSHAVELLVALNSDGGYGPSFATAVSGAMSTLVTSGEVTAQAAVDVVAGRVSSAAQYLAYGDQYQYYFAKALGSLMALAASDAPGMDAAVTASLTHLLESGSVSASKLVSTLASQMGVGNTAEAIGEQIVALVSAHALTADEAVTALTIGTDVSMAPKQQIAHAIAGLIESGLLTAAQAMADIANARYQIGSSEYGAVNLMALVAGQNPTLIAEAAAAIPSILTDWYKASDAIYAIHNAMTLDRMPVDIGIALLTAMVGDGHTAVPASAVGTEIGALISQNKITATQATADVHAAVTGHTMGVDAAVALLANAAAGASSAVQIAINSELSALISGELITSAHAGEVLRALAAEFPNNAALQSAINSQLGVVGSADPSTGIFSSLDTTTDLATLNGAADQLYTLIHSGQTSAQAVMDAIDHALSAPPPTLTNAQAISLLIGIGGHGDIAVQAAAGEELAKVFAASGPITNMSWISLQNTFGAALNAGTLTNQEAVGMLIAAIGAPGTTDGVRSSVIQITLGHLFSANWVGTNINYREGIPANMFASTLDAMLAAHLLTGPEAIRVAFVMTGDDRINRNAEAEIVALIGSGRVTGAEIHTAITSGWWRVDAAVMTLAGISESPAALGEIATLIAEGTITAARLISAIHSAWTPNPDYMLPKTTSVDDVIRVLGAIAATGAADAISAVGSELIAVLKAGQISGDQFNTLLAGAGTSHDAVVENVLGQLGALATNVGRADLLVMALVAANVTTLDHALGAITASAGIAGLTTVLNLAMLYDGLPAAQVGAAIEGMVASHALTADQAVTMYCKFSGSLNAYEAISALISNGQIWAVDAIQDIALHSGLDSRNALIILLSFAPSTDPMVQGAVAAQVYYAGQGFDQKALALLSLANNNASWTPTVTGFLMHMIRQGEMTVTQADGIIGQAMAHGLPAGNALPIIAQIGAQVPEADRAAFFGDITAMVADGRATAAQGVAALAGVAMSSDPTLQQAIGAQLLAIVNGDPTGTALHGVSDAVAAHLLTGAQAAGLLIGMTTSWNVPATVVAEIDALLTSGQMTPAQVISAVDHAVTANTLTAAGAIAVLTHCVAENASLNQVAGREIADLIAAGKIGAQQAMFAINGTIGLPMTVDQTMALFGAIANSGQYDGGALNTAIVTNISTLIFSNGVQINEAVAGIRHAVVSGAMTADQAVTLLAGMAAQGDAAPETEIRGAMMHDAAIATISEVISGALNSFQSILAAFGADAAANMSMLTEIAGHANASFQAQFGTYIAQQVANASMTPAAAVAAVHDALVADTITPEQALTLFANMSAAVAIQPGASELNGPVNAAIQAMINNSIADDDHISGRHAIEVLKALGANGGFELTTATAAEINMLLGDPRTLITSAATAGLDMNEAGAKLAAMVNAGQIGAYAAVSGIAAQSMAGSAMTGEQAVAFLLSVMSHGTANGWAIDHGTPGATNWQALGSFAFAQMENYGVAPSVIMTGIHNAVTSFELTGQQAAILLAGLVGHADLREAATGELARLLNDGGQMRVTAAEAIAAIANTVSTGYANPGVLTPALAVDALVAISLNPALPGDRGLLAAGLTALPGLEAGQLVEAISGAIAAHSLTGAQALAILLPVATAGDGTVRGEVGQALAALVQNHQIALTDIRNSIRADVITPDTALVVLTGMIGLADGVMATIDNVRDSWGIDAERLIADLHGALSARTMFGEGVSANQVMAVLATLPSSYATEITNEIGSLISQGVLSRYGAVAALAEAAGEGTADMQRTVAAVFANMIHSYDPAFGPTISGLVPGSMTADQAIAVFAAMSATSATGNTAINLDNLARVGINALIASGQITAAQAMTDIVGGLTSGILTADQTVGLIAGVAGSTDSAPVGVLVAAGQALNAMFASGQISVVQAMADLDRGLMYQYMANVQAGYDAAGLTTTSAPALLAAIMATTTDAGVIGNASAELMTMVNSHRVTVADAMSGIHGAVTSGALTAAQALNALANIDAGANSDMQAAIGAEMSSLVSGGMISAINAVASLAVLANSGNVGQEIAAGQAIAALVAEGTVTADQAVAGIRSAVDAHTLGADNALAALVGLSIGGSEALRAAAHGAIVAIVAADPTHATAAFTFLENVARQSDTSVASSVGNALGALIGNNLISTADAMGLIHQTFQTTAAIKIVAMLAGIAGSGDAVLQAAAGLAFADLTDAYTGMPPNASGAISAALAAGNLTPDQAVVMLAAAIPGTSPYAQVQVAGQIATLVNGGQIDAAHVMTDIHNAVVSHALTPDQALTAMAYISVAGASDLRLAVMAETSNLVATGQLTAAEALTALITVASGGAFHLEDGTGVVNTSVTLQSLTGSMVASLIDHGQLTAAQLGDAIAARVGFYDYHGAFGTQHAMALLIGISVNGAAAAQSAAGDGLAGLVQSHVTYAGAVLAMVDSAIVSHTITSNKAVTLLMNFAAALPSADGYNTPAYISVAQEISSLTSRGLISAGEAFGTMLAAAANNPAAALAAGAGIGTIWTNEIGRYHTDFVASDYIGAEIEAAVRNGSLTGPEAITMLLGVGMASTHAGDAGTELKEMIRLGLVTADQVVATLAGIGAEGTALQLATVSKELFAAMPAAQAVESIGHLIEAHTITGRQGITLLSSFAAAGTTATQILVGHEIASLLGQGALDAATAMNDISRAVQDHTIPANEAVLMLSGTILGGNAAVQTAASNEIFHLVAFNMITAANAMLTIRGAITSHDITADQALGVMANLAATSTTGIGYAVSMQDAFAAEVAAQIAAGITTAAHAVEVLSAIAGHGSAAVQNAIGQEIGVLIMAGQITAVQAMATIDAAVTSHAMTADQAVALLAKVAVVVGNSDTYAAFTGAIAALVSSNQITAAQAMADIGAALGSLGAWQTNVLLFSIIEDGSMALRDAAAATVAALLTQGHDGFWTGMQRAVSVGVMTVSDVVGMLALVAFHGDAAQQAYVSDTLLRLVETRGDSMGYRNAITQEWAMVELLRLAKDGSAAFELFIGREFSMLLASRWVQVPVEELIIIIDATVRPIQVAPGVHAPIDPDRQLSGAQAVMVLEGILKGSLSAEDAAAVTAEIQVMLSYSNPIELTSMIGKALADGALTAEQTMQMFSDFWNKGAGFQAAVVHEIATLYAQGLVTFEQISHGMSTHSVEQQLTVVTGLLREVRGDITPFAEHYSKLMLQGWGVATTSAAYGALQEALAHVAVDYAAIKNNQMTSPQVLADLRSYAAAHSVSADILIASMWSTMQLWAPNALANVLMSRELTNDMTGRLHDGTISSDIADMVLAGSLSMTEADAIMREIAIAATPLNPTAQLVLNHQMTVGYANEHYPGWTNNSWYEANTVATAVALMHIDVRVPQCAEAVANGTMTAAAAAQDILHAAGNSAYAADLGLSHLADALHAAGNEAGRQAVADVMGPRMSDGTSEVALSQMVSFGWISPQQALDLLEAETEHVTAGLPADEATMMSCMFLARLDMAASGLYPVTDGVPALEALLQSTQERKLEIAQGVGTLMTVVGHGNAQEQQACYDLITQITRAYIVEQIRNEPPAPPPPSGSGSSGESHYDQDKFTKIAQFVGDKVIAGVELAYTKIIDNREKIMDGNKLASIIGRDIVPDVTSAKAWVDLGTEITATGIPGVGMLTGMPNVQTYLLNQAAGDGAGTAFTAVSIGSMIAVQVLTNSAIMSAMEDAGVGGLNRALTVGFKAVSATCGLITGTISGTLHTYVDQHWEVGRDLGNMFSSLGSGNLDSIEQSADALGRQMFLMTTGVGLGEVAAFGTSLADVIVDLSSGDPQDLEASAAVLGHNAIALLESNPYLKMAGGVLSKYGTTMAELTHIISENDRQSVLITMFLLGI
ncbi:MAG: hypothetical protein JWN71_208 [Xanthobacteraceae bacterium]|nr:hypothetical protein [Xanthobacteraceae bacterium]